MRTILTTTLAQWGQQSYAFPNGDAALAFAAEHPLDLVLLDVMMPGPSAMALAESLWRRMPGLLVVLITAYGDTTLAVEAMHHGAFYYLDKPFKRAELREVLDRAQARVAQFPPGLRALTPRESDVLRLLAEGRSDAEIARALSLSARTVHHHVRHILERLEVRSRTKAAVLWTRYTR
ncbi:MAG: response regulator transcription factor [Anaerolineae bacterium]|nr:response regulator transcription factor [Anaerolineae bacterium]